MRSTLLTVGRKVVTPWVLGVVLVAPVVALAACVDDPAHREQEPGNASDSNAALVAVAGSDVATASRRDPNLPRRGWTEAQAVVVSTVDSTDRMLRRVRGLSRQEKDQLRRDVNA